MKTAVEKIEEYLKWTGVVIERPGTRCILQEEINKAKQIEKQQILDAYNFAFDEGSYNSFLTDEEYYNNTYKKTT